MHRETVTLDKEELAALRRDVQALRQDVQGLRRDTQTMETRLSAASDAHTAAIAELSAKVDAYTTDQGSAVATAVAAAIAAHEAGDDAAFDTATAAIKAIGDKLVAFTPATL